MGGNGFLLGRLCLSLLLLCLPFYLPLLCSRLRVLHLLCFLGLDVLNLLSLGLHVAHIPEVNLLLLGGDVPSSGLSAGILQYEVQTI